MGLAQFPENSAMTGKPYKHQTAESRDKASERNCRAGTPTSYKHNGVVIEVRTYTPWEPAPQDKVSPKIIAVPTAIWTLLAAGNLLDLRGDTLVHI